ncbi:MAG: hypothetical protein GX350_02545 [Erysipelotrichaceae bacterium]|nr:hypothetical protein [Erysipelotrichaceae bacterium]
MKNEGQSSKNIFVRFWNWLKATAWIQPLLIVGIIFAIIFSIPAISGAIQDNQSRRNNPFTYYSNNQITLNQNKKNNAYDFVSNYFDEVNEKNPLIGEKFFLVIVDENCQACESAQPGFKHFQDLYKSELKGYKQTVRTIFADEETDENLITSPFKTWLSSDATISLLEEAVDTTKDRPYYQQNMLGQSSYEAADSLLKDISEPSEDSGFYTPTVFLFDFTEEASTKGVIETFVSIPGNTNAERAYFLYQAWTSTGVFAG